jgi:hypothetical protein
MTVGWKPETLSEIAGQDEIRIGSGRMGGGCNKAGWVVWLLKFGVHPRRSELG